MKINLGFVGLMAGLAMANAEVKLAENFSEGMVFQRGKPIPVWGEAKPGEAVTVSLGEAKASAKADPSGAWRVSLPAREAGTGLELQVNDQKFANVAVGEVWILAGGGNMGWPLAQSREIQDQEMLDIKAPGIRWVEPGKGWREAQGKQIGSFPAVGWFFAQELAGKLKVPVGIIALTEAGSQLSQWQGDLFKKLVQPWAAFPVAGVLWYQGESDVGEATGYGKRFGEFIGHWRKQFGRIGSPDPGQEALPFYFVRLANYGLPQSQPVEETGGWTLLREEQKTAIKLANTEMLGAPLSPPLPDTVSGIDIHGIERKQLGTALAQRALAKLYAPEPPKPDPAATPPPAAPPAVSAPAFERMEAKDGTLRLYFKVAPGGFDPAAATRGFALRGKEGNWKWAEVKLAAVDGSKDLTIIELSNPEVAQPEAARYNWSANPIGKLTDRQGKGLATFRTDN